MSSFSQSLVWLDTRNSITCDQLLSKFQNNKDYFRPATGLPITTYFSATKLKWLFDNVPAVKEAAEKGNCLFGTIDSWLIWVRKQVS